MIMFSKTSVTYADHNRTITIGDVYCCTSRGIYYEIKITKLDNAIHYECIHPHFPDEFINLPDVFFELLKLYDYKLKVPATNNDLTCKHRWLDSCSKKGMTHWCSLCGDFK